jgi:hypothetical protein
MIGIGVGIGRQRFASGIFAAYAARVAADGGITESGQCVDAVSALMQTASLLLVPSGYKSGKVYSEIPTNGNGDLTFTRASSATRVNSAGLIEKPRTNLLLYSEQFNNAYWLKLASTITADAITAPNGTLTADQISESTSSTSHGVFPSSGTNIVVGQSYTASMYVKKGNRIYCGLQAFFNTTNGAIAFFNLDNGTLLYEFAQGSGYSITNSSITNVGNDWYLLRGTFTFGATSAFVGVCIASTQWTTGTSYNNVYAGDTSKFIYAWGAQLEEGVSATEYISTTTSIRTKFAGITQDGASATGVPRLDYSQGSCPALLLEPQRTNLLLYSEQFDDAYWSKANLNISGTPSWINALLSPDGTQNAEILIPNNTTNAHQFAKTDVGYVADTNFTFSCFLKENGFRYAALNVALRIGSTFQENASGLIDLQSKTITIITSNIIFRDVKVENLGDFQNGFTRYSISVKTPISGSDRLDVNIRCVDSSGASILGDNVGGFGVWGAQLEVGAYATSYIPTTTATVTRISDVFSRDNIFTNGLITSSGGTWFVELRGNLSYKGDSGGDGIFLQTTGNSDNLRLFSDTSTSRIIIFKRVSNVNTPIYTTTTDTTKIAIKWNGSTADVFANGTKVVSATTFTATQMQDFVTSINAAPKFIQQMALYPTPLSDTDCIALTTL